MVSVCLPSDALLQHLLSYLGFSYLGCGVSLHCCSSKAQPLLLTLDEGYLLTAALPDLQRGIAPLGPPVPTQPRPWKWGWSSWPLPLATGVGLLLLAAAPGLKLRAVGYLLLAAAPDLGCRVTPLGRHPSGMGSSQLLPLSSVSAHVAAACALACPSQPPAL